ncbi:MAG TPA: hypothetical protein VL523_08805 [Terriglobia bacterium]|nr:hypothetical protein [Terriglobia bacterium]
MRALPGITAVGWVGLAVAGALLLPGAAWSGGQQPGSQAAGEALREQFAMPVAAGGSFDLSPDGRLLAAVEDDGSVSVVDTASGNVIRTFGAQGAGGLSMVRFSPNGRLLAAALPGGVAIWDVSSGSSLRTFPVQAASLAFSPDGRWLAVGEGAGAMAIRIFDVPSGAMIRSWTAGPQGYRGVYNLAFAPDGTRLFSSQGHERAKEWDPGTGALVRTLPGNLPYWNPDQAAAFSPDGRLLALREGGQCEIVDLSTGSPVRRVAKGLHGEPLGFTSDGRELMVLLDSELGEGGARQHDVGLWDVGTGKAAGIIPLGTYRDFAMAKVLVSPSANLLVRLQDNESISVSSLVK